MKRSKCNYRSWVASVAGALLSMFLTLGTFGDVFYVTDLNRVAKVSAGGVVSTFLQEPSQGLNVPLGITLDGLGNLYISNNAGNDILKISPGAQGTVFLHTNVHVNDGIATDILNNVYLAETLANTILKVSPDGTQAVLTDQVNRPGSLAVDTAGNVYSANWDGTISKISPGGSLSTIATGINGLGGIAVNGDGNVYASDYIDNSILKIASNGSISTFASGLQIPVSAVFGSNGDLYVLNNGNITEVTLNGVLKPFASGLVGPSGNIAVQAIPEPAGMMVWAGLCIGALNRHR